jgi:D-aspartate ligase
MFARPGSLPRTTPGPLPRTTPRALPGALPGAIVVGGDYQGLGVLRSLRRRGIDVLVLDDRPSICRWSRYATRCLTVPDLSAEKATVRTLEELASVGGCEGWVVFPTRDETVATLARNRDRLRRLLRIPTPAWSTIRWTWDKRNTYAKAQALGIPTPRTWTLASPGDLSSVGGEPPFAIKPAIKEPFFHATASKAWRADSRAQLIERVGAAAALIGLEQVLVQELVPGGGETQLAYCAFFKDGVAQASMTVMRLRQHPAQFGRASTFVRTIDLPQLEEASERFLRAIGYYGLVEIEYKRDPRDGRLKLLDVNARTWGYHSLGQRAGVDFPHLLWTDQVGPPSTKSNRASASSNRASASSNRARAGVSWVRLATDLPSAASELCRRRLSWRAYVATLRACDVEAVFSREDPAPWLADLVLLPRVAAGQVARRLSFRQMARRLGVW